MSGFPRPADAYFLRGVPISPATPANGDAPVYDSATDEYAPAAAGGTLTTLSSFITAAVSLPNGTITEVTSLDLTAGTWFVIATVLNSTESIACPVDFWLDSVSGAKSAAPYGGNGITQNAAGTSSFFVEASGTVTALITLTGSQTVYLNAIAQGQNGSLAYENGEAVGGATGMIAIKTA